MSDYGLAMAGSRSTATASYSLSIAVGGSTFSADIRHLQPWTALLNCANQISLNQNGRERVRVELGGLRRWVAFRRSIGSSPFHVIGYQETVGAIHRGDMIIGGSNRKTLCWVGLDGNVFVGDDPLNRE